MSKHLRPINVLKIPFSTPCKVNLTCVPLLFLKRTLETCRKSCSDPSSCGFWLHYARETFARVSMEQMFVPEFKSDTHSLLSVMLMEQVVYFIPSMCNLCHVREEYLLAQDLEQKRLERVNVWAVPFLLQNWHCRTSLWDRPTPSTVKNII